jgi:hypothetical protein
MNTKAVRTDHEGTVRVQVPEGDGRRKQITIAKHLLLCALCM